MQVVALDLWNEVRHVGGDLVDSPAHELRKPLCDEWPVDDEGVIVRCRATCVWWVERTAAAPDDQLEAIGAAAGPHEPRLLRAWIALGGALAAQDDCAGAIAEQVHRQTRVELAPADPHRPGEHVAIDVGRCEIGSDDGRGPDLSALDQLEREVDHVESTTAAAVDHECHRVGPT